VQAAPPQVHAQSGAVVQFQIQGQAWQMQPFDTQPFGGQAGITLLPGTPKNQHVSYSGSVRSRVYAHTGGKAQGYRLTLEVSAEPRLQEFAVVGTPTLEKAIDD